MTHTEACIAQLERGGLIQFDGSPRLRALVEALVGMVQEAENLASAVLAETRLPVAVGAHVERWGEIVGCRRDGIEDDDEYRRLIAARIAANRSNGQASKVLDIASALLVAAVRYRVTGRAEYRLEWESDELMSEAFEARVIELLLSLRPAGVQCALVRGMVGAFRFDSGPGFDDGTLAQRLA